MDQTSTQKPRLILKSALERSAQSYMKAKSAKTDVTLNSSATNVVLDMVQDE